MSRRGKAEILKDILVLCRIPRKKTELVYQCNLNFKVVKRYIALCFSKGWLQKTDNKFEITSKGVTYLDNLIPVVENIQF